MTEYIEQPSDESQEPPVTKLVGPYTPKDLQAIADALGVPRSKLSTLHVSLPGITVSEGEVISTFPLDIALQEVAQNYLSLIPLLANPSRPAQRKKKLKTLHTRAQRLSNAFQAFALVFEHLDDTTRRDIMRTPHPRRPAYEWLEELEGVVGLWRTHIYTTLIPFLGLLETAKQRVPDDKNGRPSDSALKVFIHLLLPIYQRATGKEPRFSDAGGEYRPGPLFRFVSACLQALARPECPEKASSLDTDSERKCPCQKLHCTPGDFQKMLNELTITDQCPMYWCKSTYRRNLGSHIKTVCAEARKKHSF